MPSSDFRLDVAVHELRTPLTALKGALELMANDQLPQETRQQMLEMANRATDRLNHRISELLNASTGDPVVLSPVDISRLSRERVVELQLVNPGLSLEHDDWPPTAVALCETDLVGQVIDNLLSNAIKHTPADTKITVSLLEQDAEVHLRVVDTGPGIPDSMVDPIFEPFQRGHTDAEGKGLGLAIARDAARRSGGQLFHEHTPGGGSTFVLRLPSAEANLSTEDDSAQGAGHRVQ